MMQHRSFAIGQRVPLDYPRRIVGAECDPEWFILCTVPQKEEGAKAWLEKNGVAEVWWPTEPGWRFVPRSKRRKVPIQRRIAPGYVFAQFDREPVWDVIRDHGKAFVTGVVGREDRPMPIPEKVLAQMQQVPGRIEAMRKKAEREREESERATRPSVGEPAKVKAGPFAGFVVDVTSINAGIVHFLLGNPAVKMSADVSALEKVALRG